ncbi:MAG TPA: siderophore-interacting protein [Acidimicrobiia bacterium]|nr:siderophore-interacting protein [Acidimicrobiia bacterium]
MVQHVQALSPRMTRVTLSGPELVGLAVEDPGASVRLLVPDRSGLVIPNWTGNEFLLPDGCRPALRTLTPRRADPATGELDVDIVIHEGGALSEWASRVAAGDDAAISGPGRGYAIDPDARAYLLAGDETAIPAVSQLLEQLPHAATIAAHVEIAHADARFALPAHPGASIEWHVLDGSSPPGDAMVTAVLAAPLPDDVRIWIAGEAAAVQRIRRELLTTRGVPRSRAIIRGYWKFGRGADESTADDES